MYCGSLGNGHTFIRLPNFMVWGVCKGEGKNKKVKREKGVYRGGGL